VGGIALIPVLRTVHVLSAGAWLGGVVFTAFVVSPPLKAMKWSEAERVRPKIGNRYAKVGTVNLVLLPVFAVLCGFVGGFGALPYAEYALMVVLFGLVAAHGAFFGRRLRVLAEAEWHAERHTGGGEASPWQKGANLCRGLPWPSRGRTYWSAWPSWAWPSTRRESGRRRECRREATRKG
jgi:uncharacterized membrane protein